MARTPQEILERSFSQVEAAEGGNLVVLPAPVYAFLGALDALRSVGVLSESDHASWKAKADGEMARLSDSVDKEKLTKFFEPRPWSAPEAKEAALRLLDGVVSDIRRWRQLPASDAAEREAWGAHATVTALYRVGLLSQDESAEWTDRINKILGDGE